VISEAGAPFSRRRPTRGARRHPDLRARRLRCLGRAYHMTAPCVDGTAQRALEARARVPPCHRAK
jgi:hypothetical protein